MNPDDFDPGPLAEAACRPGDGRWTLVFVRDLRHPPEKVWAALTDPHQLSQWAPFTPDRNLAATGPATLRMVEGDRVQEYAAEVTQAMAPTLLEYTWGDALLRWEVEASPTGSRLTLRHTVDSRDSLPKFAAGWHLCLVVAERLLDGRPIGPIVGTDARNHGWDRLHDEYAERLGIHRTEPDPDDARPAARPGA